MVKPGFLPLRANLGQQVYQYLLDRIYKMEIEPGTQLGIGEIADQLGVSRSPVRDAFLMLTSDGMLELLPSGGYRVIQFTRKYIDDVFIVRHALELAAVRLSVQNLDRERIQQLRDSWAQFMAVEAYDPALLERHWAGVAQCRVQSAMVIDYQPVDHFVHRLAVGGEAPSVQPTDLQAAPQAGTGHHISELRST